MMLRRLLLKRIVAAPFALMFVADNGSDWYVSGAPDPRWDDDQLGTLGRVTGRAFEVVRMTGLTQ